MKSMKNPNDPLRIELATFSIVAQCLNQLSHRGYVRQSTDFGKWVRSVRSGWFGFKTEETTIDVVVNRNNLAVSTKWWGIYCLSAQTEDIWSCEVCYLYGFFVYHILSHYFGSILHHCIYGCMFCVFLFNSVNYVLLLLCIVMCYVLLLLCMFCSVYCLIMLFCVLFVCKCVLYYSHWVETQWELTIIYHIISYQLLASQEELCSMESVMQVKRPKLWVVLSLLWTADGGTAVKVLHYKSEGRWFDSRWRHWNFSLI
jgi:hypothetical protein